MFFMGKIGCIREKWLYLGKSGCIRENIGCIRANWLYLSKVVVFWQSGCV